LTDTGRSALQLLDAVNCPNVKSLWQPITESSHQNNLRNIELIAPYLTNVHIFYWAPITYDRRMLSEGIDHWREYLKKIAALGDDRYGLLEFVQNDDPQIFRQDITVLKQILSEVSA
jgi:sugar phosphate isomerase/epimerase